MSCNSRLVSWPDNNIRFWWTLLNSSAHYCKPGYSGTLGSASCLQFGSINHQYCWDKVKDVAQSARPNTVGGLWWKTESDSYTHSQKERRLTIVWQMTMAEWESFIIEDLMGSCCTLQENLFIQCWMFIENRQLQIDEYSRKQTKG